MEAAASDGPMEGLPLRLEKCRATFPQPSHRTLEIVPATSRLHDFHSRLENADTRLERSEIPAVHHDALDLAFMTFRVSHSSHRPYSYSSYYDFEEDTQKRPPHPRGVLPMLPVQSVTLLPGRSGSDR